MGSGEDVTISDLEAEAVAKLLRSLTLGEIYRRGINAEYLRAALTQIEDQL